ncbi:S-adenosylmethionine:tRNA ribosyltransferase-isomerase [Kutzneria albida]|uniref:Queuosine biosynthesis protein n=1 Tax=Kutzneria albida DSM 43870 TaxID=1449976 RepID=W5W6Y9_9PSEU|nr:S-adenosylmethionine:tRNA ribosyltransferase-isomerase [Kutzneria albida]AHH96296.1 Queuosine biosynthesis protein [Kutzneria albida DSM 43870]
MTSTVEFTLPAELEAHEPPEARGLDRDGVRLLVSRCGSGEQSHHRFTELPDLLAPGDVLVVNNSGTMPAAVPVAGTEAAVHFSTEQSDGTWLVEVRRSIGRTGQRLPLVGGGSVRLLEPYSQGRLWVSDVDTAGLPTVSAYLMRHGQPIRYDYVPRPWALPYYQTVFATHPGSAEMPSAARPFTDHLVTRLVSAGVLVVPITLHTGVASAEAHERPYPERYQVGASTARVVNAAKESGNWVIGVGTTAVRALESAVGSCGLVHPARGWTDLVITPERGVRVVDGLLTGFHEPRASHLDLLAAVAGRESLAAGYAEAVRERYLWHEFGDVNLLLP